eukprot:1157736-Pelagomonas_calceolata.AAC.7
MAACSYVAAAVEGVLSQSLQGMHVEVEVQVLSGPRTGKPPCACVNGMPNLATLKSASQAEVKWIQKYKRMG